MPQFLRTLFPFLSGRRLARPTTHSLAASDRSPSVLPGKGPRHADFIVIGREFEPVLRELERKAGLPEGDLCVGKSEPREVTTFPTFINGLESSIDSATSEKWRADPEKQGYIAGSLLKTTGPADMPGYLLEGMNPLVAAMRNADAVVARLYVHEDCPAVFDGGNVCTGCGYKLR